VGIKS